MNYEQIAKEVRRDVLTLLNKGQTSHAASNLSLTDLAVGLYENLKEEDFVIFSKGWASALHYILEIRRGKLNRDEVFNTFPNPPYLGLLESQVPTVITAGGSVGHGLNVGKGLALGLKKDKKSGIVYVICSDGEMQEGSTWEAALSASHNRLDNLVVIIDRNTWQAMGKTEEVCEIEPLHEKWEAFGWEVNRINGHNFDEIERAICGERQLSDRPLCIIGDTEKGHGVSFMVNHLLFHYKHVTDEELELALAELQ